MRYMSKQMKPIVDEKTKLVGYFLEGDTVSIEEMDDMIYKLFMNA